MKYKVSAEVRAKDPVHHDYVPAPMRRLIRKAFSCDFAGFNYGLRAAQELESFDPQLDGILQRAIERQEGAEDGLWVASHVLGTNLMTAVTLVLASTFSARSDVIFAFKEAEKKGDVLKIGQQMLGKRISIEPLLSYMGVTKESDGSLTYHPLADDLTVSFIEEAMASRPLALTFGSIVWPE